MITEEHITIATANKLAKNGWEIISVHPPDGQGPFTIPKPPQSRAIERASYHPDIVAIKSINGKVTVILVECKVNKPELAEDIEKFRDLVNNPESLYFICFRCQKFDGGPDLGVDYETLIKKEISFLPIEFGLAYKKDTGDLELPKNIEFFNCREFSFAEEELIK